MLLRRRCLGVDLPSFIVAVVATVLVFIGTIVYGTRSDNAELLPFVKGILPAGRCLCQYSTTFSCDTCLDCATTAPVILNHTEESPKGWTFTYGRDDLNEGLDFEQCNAAFPGLFEDIHRATKVRWGNHVTKGELESFEFCNGMVRAMIYDGEVRLLSSQGVEHP
jgi:hypothetical protein